MNIRQGMSLSLDNPSRNGTIDASLHHKETDNSSSGLSAGVRIACLSRSIQELRRLPRPVRVRIENNHDNRRREHIASPSRLHGSTIDPSTDD